jgi:hypothetical protein
MPPAPPLDPAHVIDLAHQAVDLACDQRTHRPSPRDHLVPLCSLLPLCRTMLDRREIATAAASVQQLLDDAVAQQTAGNRVRFTDGRGHSRPIYVCLALHLLTLADPHATAPPPLVPPSDSVELAAWHAVLQPGDHVELDLPGADVGPRPLHPQPRDEPPDTWVYRELTALHAVDLLARRSDSPPGLAARVDAAADYHQQHTQPDYTTYQPWALVALMTRPTARLLAEQQLHEAQSHLAIEGGPGAVVMALLLTEAAYRLHP